MSTELPSSDHYCQVEIKNRRGLHARAAAKIVKALNLFSAEVRIRHQDKEVLATSIMGMMFLGASQGSIVDITATGPDAPMALKAVKRLIEEKFSEE